MCIGVPGRVVEIYSAADIPMGRVDVSGVLRDVCLVYVPDVQAGDHVIVHAGFAVDVIDAAEAEQTLDLLRSVTDLR